MIPRARFHTDLRLQNNSNTADAEGQHGTEASLRLALDFSDIGDWSWDAHSDALTLSATACRIFGVAAGTRMTWSEMQGNLLHPEDAPRAAAAVLEAIAARSAYRIDYRMRRADGGEAWVLTTGKAHYDEHGTVIGMVGLVQDVTDRKHAQLALAEEAATWEILNRTGAVVASELNIEKVVQAVTDAGRQVTGAQFGAFFYNTIDASGQQYMLYTLSGVPREAFAKFPKPRITPIFEPTFSGTGTVRSDDITQDPRYGRFDRYHGMPPGHLPVRSYLAVPVLSRTGEVIGSLLFGHSQPGMFGPRAERVLVGISAQAAIAIDNGRLYERAQRDLLEKQRAERDLQALATMLEERVRERTAELEASNLQLKQEIEERERTQDVLRHSQKLEAIGQLTGGVAHDFNNLLTVVIGNIDTVARRLNGHADGRVSRALEHALEGARKAAALTQRLLAFARRQPLKPQPADPNRLVQQMSELLFRTLGERIEIRTVLAPGVWPIEVDVGQLENAILNLAVNARDAMPEGGRLTIETRNVSFAATDARGPAMMPGHYVFIGVSDTGSGIPRELLDKVFDPFFTTKTTGQGTGLGLSQVYGFVKQSGGNVYIDSESGAGTTVRLYLRRFLGKVEEAPPAQLDPLPSTADETVLVVEDDTPVRHLTMSLLEELGYRVVAAADAAAAMQVVQGGQRIDLLFTDVGLPRTNGRELAELARQHRPGLKVLFTSGYAKTALMHHGRLDPNVDLIGKPFTFAELSAKVRAVLDRR